MRFNATALVGAWLIELDRVEDERGHFARTYDRHELAIRELEPAIAQCSVSFNHKRGTVRGLHFQAAPHEETKLVRCTRGAIWDVIVDLRPESATFLRHFAVWLTADEGAALYIPPGFAHGFQTLEDATEVYYQISVPYAPESARGYRFDDPAFRITWPEPVTVISERDLNLPLYPQEATQESDQEKDQVGQPGGEGT